ncbi:MAG: alpha/beta fold hydrolase [Myxococcota bacterium]|nr:alpha/beta fold hydrolase [Myxococcota bacterium]
MTVPDRKERMRSESLTIAVGASRTTGILYGADAPRAALVLAHGAGAPQTHPWMVAIARAVAARGVDVVTFNFLYTEEKRRVPDKNDRMEETWRAAIRAVRARDDVMHARLFIGGKSMGARIATQVAAKADVEVAGLVLLGYPLHPPGKPEQMRAAHLPSVRAPMLFVQGSRDAFGSPVELAPIVRRLVTGTRLSVVEAGDHSFASAKRNGESFETMMGRVADEVVAFTESR